MARPIKTGLSFFPLDIGWDQDIKVRYIINEYKGDALAVIPKLFARIYQEGYYIEVSEVFFSVMASDCFQEIETVKGIVEAGLKSGLFNREKYDAYGILTSKRIQENYLRVKRDSAKKSIPLHLIFRPEFLLLDIDQEDLSEVFRGFTPIIPDNPRLSPQRKVNKREKKINNIPPISPQKGEERMEGEETFLEGDNSSEDETIVKTWNEVFPMGTTRYIKGKSMKLNHIYKTNIPRTLSEYPVDTPDGVETYRRAFTTLRDSDYNWQLHSAIKLENLKMLLTEAENAKKPRSSPGSGGNDTSHRAPVTTREDYLANPFHYHGPKVKRKEEKNECP